MLLVHHGCQGCSSQRTRAALVLGKGFPARLGMNRLLLLPRRSPQDGVNDIPYPALRQTPQLPRSLIRWRRVDLASPGCRSGYPRPSAESSVPAKTRELSSDVTTRECPMCPRQSRTRTHGPSAPHTSQLSEVSPLLSQNQHPPPWTQHPEPSPGEAKGRAAPASVEPQFAPWGGWFTAENETWVSPGTDNSEWCYKTEQFIWSFGAACSFLYIPGVFLLW